MQIVEAAIRRARSTPDAPAVVSAEATLSWQELIDTVARFATLFGQQGVRPGQIVAVSGEFSPIVQTALIVATWYRAAISCTVTGSLLARPPFAIDWVISPTPAVVEHSAGGILLDGPALARVGLLPPQAAPQPFPSTESLCRLAFSSGTTGRPKAVPFTISRLSHRIRQAREQWMPQTPFMSVLGLNAASGFLTFAECLRSGMPYLVPGTSAQNVALLRDHGVRVVKASPAQLSGIAAELTASGVRLPELRVIESAGSFLPEGLSARLRDLTDARLVNLYGSCEAGTVVIGDPATATSGLVGDIVEGVEMQAVDERGRPLPEGADGIIRLRRPGQMEGYFHDPGSTRAVFVDGWFYPGDYGSIRSGMLSVRGRVGDIINAAGVKVLPSEVEQTLLGFDGIGDVAVFGERDELGVERIAAAFTGELDAETEGWAGRARALLGEAAPRRYVRVAEIPRNDNGKILRDELARRAGLR